MWGREFRAGVWFVLVSLLVGSAIRAWRGQHETRFQDLIASLEESREADATGTDLGDSAGADSVGSGRSHAGSRGTPGIRTALRARPGSVDPNRADARELEALPGIGPALAARIVADRTEHGPFTSPEGLLRVSGVGPKTLERVRPYLAFPSRPDSAR